MFTREDLFLYFSDRFSEDQIKLALIELAKVDPEIDPEATEFHGSIVERLEGIFKVVNDAIASNKQLPGTSTLAQIEETAINLASDRAIPLQVDTIKGLIEILDAEAAVEAVALFERRKTIREGVLTQLEVNALRDANEQASIRMDTWNQLSRDPETLDQILQDYGLLSTQDLGKQHLELTASSSLDFNVDEFLALGSNEKKQHPKTIADTKRLAQSLISRARR